MPDGVVSIAVEVGEPIVPRWTEHGGPHIGAAPQAGFGLKLSMITSEHYLGGKLTLDWLPEALQAIAIVPTASLMVL